MRGLNRDNFYFRMKSEITDFNSIFADHQSAGVTMHPDTTQSNAVYSVQLTGKL